MNPRVNYEMTEGDLSQIKKACKPVPCMMIGGSTGPSQQENANSAWASLGEKMGFDSMTVRPSGKGMRFFTAVPSETETQKWDRVRKEEEAKVTAKRKELTDQIDRSLVELRNLNGGEYEYNVFMDGDSVCATKKDFINLQESPAGFGDTEAEAIANLEKQL